MSGLNKCMFIGRLGRDPHVKNTQWGTQAFCSIAVAKEWTNSDGSKGGRTDWIPLAFKGRLADVVARYVHKGDRIHVTGALTIDSKSDGKGGYTTSVMVRVDELLMLNTKADNQGGMAQAPSQPAYQPHQQPASPAYAQQKLTEAQNYLARQGQAPLQPPQGQAGYNTNQAPQIDDDEIPF